MKRATRPARAQRVGRRRPRLTAAIAALALLAVVLALLRFAPWRGQDPPSPAPAQAVEPPPPRPAARPVDTVAFSQGCTSAECHSGLLPGPGVHAPDAEEACDACHAPDTGGHVYPLAGPPDTLCDACHDTGRSAPVQHAGLTVEGCLACHDPHAANHPALLAASTLGETCTACHPAEPGSHRHPPYVAGECAACHEPHGSEYADLLRGGEGIDHCAMCHADTIDWMSTARHTHLGIEGECLACHGPHATRHEHLLVAEPRDGCTACHQEIGHVASNSLITHDPVLGGKQCITCHAAHASDEPMMLREDQTELCLECHAETITGRGGRVIPAMTAALAATPGRHGPVASGNCSACHSVHGANHARLLAEINPAVLAGPFDLRNYALCFACHDQQLALADTPTATAFRDGLKNLHRVHAQPSGRARGCADCHAIHASHQPSLIAEKIAYEGSDWLMDMNFRVTEDGGTCAPGCHEPLSYSRTSPTTPETEGGAP